MKRDSLSQIGKKINEIRKKKKISLKEVGEKADVTAGLLSKIENFRAVPSLPVLQRIATALDVTMADLVVGVTSYDAKSYLIVRKADREREFREDSKELIYESLLSQDIHNLHMRTTVVTVNPKVYRKPISTEAMEQVFVVSGKVIYKLDDEKIELREGDSMYFDGNIPHSIENKESVPAILFKIYLLNLANDNGRR